MPADWPNPGEIDDSSASHAALSWPALRFAPMNAEVRFLAGERPDRTIGTWPTGRFGGDRSRPRA